jgi:hypothetical protein
LGIKAIFHPQILVTFQNIISGLQRHGVLFLKGANQEVRLSLFNPPWSFRYVRAGREVDLFGNRGLWSLALQKFRVKLPVPWNEAYLCGLLKETPMALPALFSRR